MIVPNFVFSFQFLTPSGLGLHVPRVTKIITITITVTI